MFPFKLPKNACSLYGHICDNSDAHKDLHLRVIAVGHPLTILTASEIVI